MNKHSTLLDKITNSQFIDEPFPHLLIEDFFNTYDFVSIINSNQIKLKSFEDTQSLIDHCLSNGYSILDNWGCTKDIDTYIKLLNENTFDDNKLEGKGLTLNLTKPDAFLQGVIDFFKSDVLVETLKLKFNIKDDTKVTANIHKYLTNYEISPHPDIRQKALTFLLNINTVDYVNAHRGNSHTKLCKVKNDYKYVTDFWKNNPNINTDNIPWDWTETVKEHYQNNSLLIFKPSFNTLHGIRLIYDHLPNQRTQIYGNLKYTKWDGERYVRWFDIEQGCSKVNAIPITRKI